jgi:hypothetical protein
VCWASVQGWRPRLGTVRPARGDGRYAAPIRAVTSP